MEAFVGRFNDQRAFLLPQMLASARTSTAPVWGTQRAIRNQSRICSSWLPGHPANPSLAPGL